MGMKDAANRLAALASQIVFSVLAVCVAHWLGTGVVGVSEIVALIGAGCLAVPAVWIGRLVGAEIVTGLGAL